MRKIIKVGLPVLIVTLLLATPVLAYLYRAPLAILESDGNAYSMLPIIVSSNNQWMADNGFMEADALDTRVQTLGGLDKPHMVSDNRTATAVPVPANSQTNLYFVTGETDLSATDIIVGYGGYITIPDDASIELANNFEVEQKGWIDTTAGADKNLVFKDDVFRIYIAGTDNITAVIGGSLTETFVPNAPGDYTNITLETPFGFAHWDVVDDPPGAPTDGDFVQDPGANADAYNLVDHTTETGAIESVTVFFRLLGDGNSTPGLRLAAAETLGTPVANTGAWTTHSEVLARPGGGVFSWADIDNLQAIISLAPATNAYCSQIYIRVLYAGSTLQVSAVGVSSGEHTVRVLATGGGTNVFQIWVGDGDAAPTLRQSVALAGSSVIGNANDYIINENNCIPYMDHMTIDVAVVEKLRYQPIAIISGTTLPDRTGTNHGIITWGANPVGVTASLGSMISSGQPTIGTTIEDVPGSVLPEATVSDWFGDGTVGGSILTNPIRPFITMVSDNTDLTEILVWRWMGVAILLFIAVATAKTLRGHLGITVIVVAATMGGLVAVDHNIYPLWLLVLAVGMFLGGLVAERSPSL